MADTTPSPAEAAASDNKRWTYGLYAVAGGLAVILVSAFIAIRHFQTSSDVVAVMGAVTAPVGTIVAAYFGVAAGSDGKSKADANAARARADAQRETQRAHEAIARAAAPMAPAEAEAFINTMYGPQAPPGS